MRTGLSRNSVSVPRLASRLRWHLALFALPGNLALDFKQMHPEGLMPGIAWYDLCSIFSHNPENFRPKRHIFSLFSICCESYVSQSYFSVNLNFPAPLSEVNATVFPSLVCCTIRKFAGCYHWFLSSKSFFPNGKMAKITFGCHRLKSKWPPLKSFFPKEFTVLTKFTAILFYLFRAWVQKKLRWISWKVNIISWYPTNPN